MKKPGPKTSTQRRAAFSKGGDTPMFGKGDRTVTAPTDAAGEQTPAAQPHRKSLPALGCRHWRCAAPWKSWKPTDGSSAWCAAAVGPACGEPSSRALDHCFFHYLNQSKSPHFYWASRAFRRS